MQAGTKLLRGETVRSMARAVGLVVSAGALAAVYQVAHDEVRATLGSWRQRAQYRQQMHNAVLLGLLCAESPLSPAMQKRFFEARDAFKEGLRVLTDPTTPSDDLKLVRAMMATLRPQPRLIET